MDHGSGAQGGQYVYCVKWKGHNDSTWEPFENFGNAETVWEYWVVGKDIV
jgi:hypothetical protein